MKLRKILFDLTEYIRCLSQAPNHELYEDRQPYMLHPVAANFFLPLELVASGYPQASGLTGMTSKQADAVLHAFCLAILALPRFCAPPVLDYTSHAGAVQLEATLRVNALAKHVFTGTKRECGSGASKKTAMSTLYLRLRC